MYKTKKGKKNMVFGLKGFKKFIKLNVLPPALPKISKTIIPVYYWNSLQRLCIKTLHNSNPVLVLVS
jgi:hypothetical protein